MDVLVLSLVTVVIIVVLVTLYLKLSCGYYEITEDLTDKTILITGGSAGIGEATVRELAKHGATVHMLCRNLTKANNVAEIIKVETKNDRIHIWELDTSKLCSVRRFVEKFLSTDIPIDVLINNAGVMWVPNRTLTEDGLEMQMATNHYGHFLLTNLLLDRIKETPGARIVNVSSASHWFANLNLDNINLNTGYNDNTAYANSKLANILFTTELSRRLQDTDVTVNVLNPGAVKTELFRHTTGLKYPIIKIGQFWFKTAHEGAQTTLYLALSEDVKNISGQYFTDCHIGWKSFRSRDEKMARDLWEISSDFTGLAIKVTDES